MSNMLREKNSRLGGYFKEFCEPSQRASLGKDTSCWTQCRTEHAGHFHIFWDCPGLSSFWQHFRKSMETILGIKLYHDFATLYLGNKPAQLKEYGKKYMCNILLVAA